MLSQRLKCAICFFVLIFASLEARELSFKLVGHANAANQEVTLTIVGTDVFLATDEDGVFRSLVDESELVDLKNGEYEYDVIFGDEIIRGSVRIDNASPEVILLDSPDVPASGGESFVGGGTRQIRRLSTVRVLREPTSDKRVLSADEARKLPGTGGDVLGSLSSLPGVVGGMGFSTQLFIRGGKSADVSYRFNDIVIGSPYHEVFFFSVFPPEILSSFTFYPGGYPADFENVQGSVIDILGKEFDDYRNPYDVTINLSAINASVSITFEFLDKFRLSFGGRRSYLEGYIIIADALGLTEALGEFDLIPTFYDAHAIFEWQIDITRNFKFIFLYSGDQFLFNFMNAEFEGATPEEKIFIDADFGFKTLWDSEAVTYESVQEKYQYNVTLYRYAERRDQTNLGVQTYNINNDEYSIRHGLDFFLSDIVTLNAYAKYSLNRGYGGNTYHPEGERPPNPNDYIEVNPNDSFGVALESYLGDLKIYNTELLPKVEYLFGHRFTLGSSLKASLYDLTLNVGVILYADTLSASKVNVDFRARGTYLFTFPKSSLEVFGYLGKYTQYPLIAAERLATFEIFFQDYPLKTPYTYQFGFGGLWTFAEVLEISLEPYYKLSRERIIGNPTYDSKFAITASNTPTINYGRGFATGIESLVRLSGKSRVTGWISYTWSRAYIDVLVAPLDFDTNSISSDPNNNGADYRGASFSNAFVPYRRNIEHSLKVIFRLGLWEGAAFSFRFIANSGEPRTQKIVALDEKLAGSTLVNGMTVPCTEDTWSRARPCDLGYVFINDPTRLNGIRLPWQLTLDLRFDWTFVKNDKFEASFFIDVLTSEALFYANVTGYSYDRSVLASDPNIIKVGEDARENSLIKSSNAVVLPVIGLEFKF